MNKNDLVAAIASGSSLSKADAAKAVDSVLHRLKGALQRRDEIRLLGFGTFSVVNRRAKVGRDPRTGAPIQIPASRQPRFKASKRLKQSVNAQSNIGL